VIELLLFVVLGVVIALAHRRTQRQLIKRQQALEVKIRAVHKENKQLLVETKSLQQSMAEMLANPHVRRVLNEQRLRGG
jgi:hypothetical protein